MSKKGSKAKKKRRKRRRSKVIMAQFPSNACVGD
jgi:hypothetical protein